MPQTLTHTLAHTFNVGTGELMVILLVALLVFGPNKLPEVARRVGKGIRKMRQVSEAFRKELNNSMAVPPEKVTPSESKPPSDKSPDTTLPNTAPQNTAPRDSSNNANRDPSQDSTNRDSSSDRTN